MEPYIREVVYLPAGAPGNEIRLLEVNTSASTPADAPPEVLDFGRDRDMPGEHSLLVADISPGQWERIRSGTLAMPPGWQLAGNIIIGRKG